MAITTGDGYIAAAKQITPYTKTASVTTIANTRYTVFAAAGNPTAGTLAGSTNPGALLTDATGGMPLLNAFAGGATGYLTRVAYANTVATRMELWDKIFAVNVSLTTLATTTMSSNPSITGRIPNGTEYSSVRLFVEITTTVSATATTVQVTYLDQSATSRAATATSSLSGFVAGRWVEIPLVAGSTGVSGIVSVTVGGTVATAGAVNVIIVRPLWTNRVTVANSGGVDGIDRTGMPVVFDTSALVLTTVADSTSSGIPDLNIEIANG